MSVIIEACCASVDDVIAAESGGAKRAELNSAISLGGLTPTTGMVREAKKHSSLPIMAMLRPRSGGFCYTDAEFETMQQDCVDLIYAGADGIVFGILHEDGTIDAERCQTIARIVSRESMKAPRRVELVFHRAFDVVPDWKIAMEELVVLGFDRILTSGQAQKAIDATNILRNMIEVANGRIEILACGGIRQENAAEIIEKTGVDQIHLHCVSAKDDKSVCNGINEICFNAKTPEAEDKFSVIDEQYLETLNKNLNAKWL